MSAAEIDVVRDRLEAFRLRWGTVDDAELLLLQTQLGELQRWLVDQPEAGMQALEESGYLAQHFELFAHCQRRCLKEQELQESAALLATYRVNVGVEQALNSGFGRDTYARVAELFELVDCMSCRRFVMVGCGPFPAAALFVCDHSASDVVALDCDAEAIAMAERVAAAFAPGRMRVSNEDGAQFDYGAADLVYVANHVFPKARVLRRIVETAGERTQVVLRDPFGYGRLFAESGVATLDSRLIVTATGAGNRRFLSRHVVLGWRFPSRLQHKKQG